MKHLKVDFFGDNNIGLYGFATSNYCLLGLKPKNLDEIKKILDTNIKIIQIAGTELVGIFASGNKNGIILTKLIEEDELKKINGLLDIKIEVINPLETTAGNLILCNDNGAIISKLLENHIKEIEDCLGVKVEIGTIAGLDIVGSCGISNNTSCLVHREATEEEIKKIERVLNVKVDIGTVSYGSPFVKSGLIVNNTGLLISNSTSGPELGRISEVFIDD